MVIDEEEVEEEDTVEIEMEAATEVVVEIEEVIEREVDIEVDIEEETEEEIEKDTEAVVEVVIGTMNKEIMILEEEVPSVVEERQQVVGGLQMIPNQLILLKAVVVAGDLHQHL